MRGLVSELEELEDRLTPNVYAPTNGYFLDSVGQSSVSLPK